MRIEKIKNANTKYIGKEILYYKTIDSTHKLAQRIVSSVKNGTIIIAQEQTSGIGTKGRNWYTGKGNIAMTIILYPSCNIKKLEGLTIKIAQIMKQVIYSLYKYNLIIKEPNDLMLNNKKISGILVQSSTQSTQVKYLLISIGFNVNEIEFSKETSKIATSLFKEYGKKFNCEDIIIKFIEILEKEIEKIG